MSSSQIFKLFQEIYNSRENLLDMLENRGFNTSKYRNFTEDDMKTLLNQHNIGKYETKSEIGPLDIYLENNDQKIYVKYRLDERFKQTSSLTAQITEIFSKLLEKKDTLIILNISRILLKPGIKDKPDELYVNHLYISHGYFVQIFGLENFLINVSKHIYVPKHRALSKQETTNLLEKYNCKLKNLPTIKRDDAQAKYIGLRPKQVCEITCNNITSGETIKYRLCVN